MKKGKNFDHIVQKRREKVRELYFFLERSVPQIVKDLKDEWSEKTIYKDVKVLKEQNQEVVDENDLKALIQRRFITHKRIMGAQWGLYAKSSDEKFKSKVLDRIHEREGTFIKHLQELGVVLKPEEKLSLSISEGIEKGYEEAMRRAEELRKIAIDRVQEARKEKE